MGEMQRPKSLFDWPVAFTKVILIVAERERERERERVTHTHTQSIIKTADEGHRTDETQARTY